MYTSSVSTSYRPGQIPDFLEIIIWAIIISIIVSIVIREIVNWYWKINARLDTQKEILATLKDIRNQIQLMNTEKKESLNNSLLTDIKEKMNDDIH